MKKWILTVLIASLALLGAGCTVEKTSSTQVNVDVSQEGEEESKPLAAAAIDIYEDLQENWSGECRVTYTEEENTVYVQCWDDGIDSENIAEISNWDEMLQGFAAMSEMCTECLKENGVEGGHSIVQYVSGEEEDAECFLEFEDEDLTYSYFE